ncbi:GPO family capsid scaffolding protein [Hydrogenovibrio marinus]|uniref:Phage capsid scaffolding protein n=1 Tax=Hydrogenovibrio marinus TaxID=28885 RepID=A0A066ZRF8_HYDMR|nr:GPO family capsid scaffolding protein [Hydrogenovibrio marinus]KDN94854.1 hypothetical protein EI16_00630 [Hydrogenovibrio marinus]BBN59314.1 phage capsid scaffolding protein [Hydrogenovibrio marinus]
MLKLGWLVILTSGFTADKREITPEMIKQMAEDYDQKKYNARINIDHAKFATKFGSVLELQAVENNGVTELQAMLEPNAYMLSVIQSGQKLHTSCEIRPNFANTGRYYLTGLALTDEPASLGTSIIKLSSNDPDSNFYSTDEVIEGSSKEEKNIFKKLLSLTNEEESMSKETQALLTKVAEEQSKTTEALLELTEKLTAGKPGGNQEDTAQNNNHGTEENATEKGDKEFATKEEMQELTTALNTAVKAFAESNKTVNDLITKLSAQTDEPARQPANGASADEESGCL